LVLTIADRVVLLHRGCIRANGSPKKILTDEALLQANDLEMPMVLRYFLALQTKAAAANG
jgi:ABC-type hemin transport system ATPase subunit